MTAQDKLAKVKAILGITGNTYDNTLNAYLEMAHQEIISWRFSYVKTAEEMSLMSVPYEYEITQINAVVAGYSIRGAENEYQHGENGISRGFKYEDMRAYIRGNVNTMVKVV